MNGDVIVKEILYQSLTMSTVLDGSQTSMPMTIFKVRLFHYKIQQHFEQNIQIWALALGIYTGKLGKLQRQAKLMHSTSAQEEILNLQGLKT